MIDEKEVACLKNVVLCDVHEDKWKEIMETLEMLWRIARAAQILLERMKLINGCDKNCIHADPGMCPNHVAIRNAEDALSKLPEAGE